MSYCVHHKVRINSQPWISLYPTQNQDPKFAINIIREEKQQLEEDGTETHEGSLGEVAQDGCHGVEGVKFTLQTDLIFPWAITIYT